MNKARKLVDSLLQENYTANTKLGLADQLHTLLNHYFEEIKNSLRLHMPNIISFNADGYNLSYSIQVWMYYTGSKTRLFR